MQAEAGVAKGEALQKSGRQAIAELRAALARVPGMLEMISPAKAAIKPAPGKWSPLEELGHLVDSAGNNHQRIVRAQSEDSPQMPGYNGDDWVVLHGYQNREWSEVIALWSAFNRQLLAAAESVPDVGWKRTCTIGGSEPLTISFVLSDYVEHLFHHLRHIGIATDALLELRRKKAGNEVECNADDRRPRTIL